MIRRLASAAILERQEPQATLLRLRLIGSIEAADSSGCDVLPSSRKSRALLAYLALNADQWVPRSRITRLLWDRVPEEQGRASLRQALHELSRAMGPMFAMIMETERERVRLLSETVWVDALAITLPTGSASRDGLPELNVFSGSLLLDGLDNLSDEFDHWLVSERQRLEERIRRWNEANIRGGAQDPSGREPRIEVARRVVAVDPTNEEAVRDLMQALANTGQRAQAVHEYERCRAILRSRLDLEPAAETQRLYRDLRRETPVELQSAAREPSSIEALRLPLADAQTSHLGDLPRGYEARPSIAVLPFREDAADPDQAYFGDGFVDNIIQGLAGLKELIVISRGSTMAYARKPFDVPTVGRELGVRYVLAGSVQRSGDKLRIATELAETEGGTVVRANRYDGQLSDLFALQDQISEEVVKTIAPSVRERELKRALKKHPRNMTAYDLVLQALDPLLYRLDHASFSRARELLQRAMELDPDYAPAFSYAARWHIFRVGQEWSTDLAADICEAERLSKLAIACDENDAIALAIYGYVQSYFKKRFDDGLGFLERAITCSPSCPKPWTFGGATLCFIGDAPRAIAHASTGLRLSPLDARVFFAEHILAQAHYVNGDFEEAIRWARRADLGNTQLTSNLRTLIASFVAIDKIEEAREVARRHQQIVPTFTVSSWAARTPMQGEVRARRIERLLGAGMPA
jgi:TolB-like protein/two-component SAPR family response regulator/Tfp pilus assembly protein PilF